MISEASLNGRLEMWGGIECSVTRIQDKFTDQIERSGHANRDQDLDLINRLGIRTIRYPILWERTYGVNGTSPNWTWSDARAAKLQELNITPIIGLLHHGSGPTCTSLLDPDFPKLFANYAYEVAKRYPWFRYFTPINEPLTTARFSGLYGHWFPHLRSDEAFCNALVNQCHAIQLSMEAICAANPDAQLVQTEDLGISLSTAELGYQAKFENERRWLSLDLLCGNLSNRCGMIDYLRRSGISERRLDTLFGFKRIPDLLGFNYYVTSARFLDDRLDDYPSHLAGGNGRIKYVDVEAVRVGFCSIALLKAALHEAWQRFKLLMALTEVHLTCEPEEQVRWLMDCWDVANEVRDAGVDVRAVTAWALFGLYDWDTLTVQQNDRYEPGIFDVSNGAPVPTLLAQAIQSLMQGEELAKFSEIKGWWSRPDRISYMLPDPMRAEAFIAMRSFI